MSKQRKKPERDRLDVLAHLELQMGIIQHCQAMRSIVELLERDQTAAAIARLDGAVAALHALVRGQCAGKTMECPACKSSQDVVAWVDDGRCNNCGEVLEVPGE